MAYDLLKLEFTMHSIKAARKERDEVEGARRTPQQSGQSNPLREKG